MLRSAPVLSAFLLGLTAAMTAAAQDITNLGGDLTSTLSNQNAIQVTAPNVTNQTRRLKQLDGFSVFHRLVKPTTGLGPLFNHRSCANCHVNNGRGPISIREGLQSGTTVILKVSRPGLNIDGSPREVPGVGQQVQDHSTSPRRRPGAIRLQWRTVRGSYPDGTPYQLRRPVVFAVLNGKVRRDLVTSLRMTPPIIGPGLLESIPDSTIVGWSDVRDENGDGISGRVQFVPDRRTGSFSIGRFGFRGAHPTLEQQSAAAAFFDIGLTNVLFAGPRGTRELSDSDLEILNLYQRLAGVPIARNQNSPDVQAGKALFQELGCDSCHKFNITTSADTDEELRNQVIHPFTDLLLHDMGPGLADKRPEFSASGNEWRTTPLWGIGFSRNISTVKPRYLHDGRARSLEEAILWHGGESEAAQVAFKNLTQAQRAQLITFLESL